MPKTDNRIYNLSIYLLKDSIKTINSALKRSDYREYNIKS